MLQGYAIGIDVGGSALKCGLINNAGEIKHYFLQPLSAVKTETDLIDLIIASILQCAAVADGAVLGVGLGFPGIVNENMILGGADNLPGFDNLPLLLGDRLEKATKYKLTIDNDANMMGSGELSFGSGKGCTDVIFLTVGTGIGGAMVLNGKIYGGYKNRGAEMGHTILKQGGERCGCGALGCFEAYASVTALIRYYKQLRSDAGILCDGKLIADLYLQNDAVAVEAMHFHFDHMAAGIAGYINVFSPQKVVIGGGISEAGDFYINAIATRVQQIVIPAAMQHTQIVAARLGNKAGMLGCAARVFDFSR